MLRIVRTFQGVKHDELIRRQNAVMSDYSSSLETPHISFSNIASDSSPSIYESEFKNDFCPLIRFYFCPMKIASTSSKIRNRFFSTIK